MILRFVKFKLLNSKILVFLVAQEDVFKINI